MLHPKNFFFPLLILIVLTACGSYKLDSDDDTPTNNSTDQDSGYLLSLQIQSENNALINYPLSLLIFNSEDECVVNESLPKGSDEYQTRLPKGRYTAIVFSGLENNGLTYPLQFTTNSYITLPDAHHAATPLLHGKISIDLNQTTTAHITLSYLVSAVRFTLSGVPSSAEAVVATVSPVSSGVTFGGDYKNDLSQATIACQKDGQTWSSTDVYVLPCTSAQTRLTIQVTLAGKSEAYSYTYPATLKPSHPYHFSGAYGNNFTLDGTFQSQGWQQTTEVEFGFDSTTTQPSDTPSPSTPDDSDASAITVDELPEEGSLWKECLVCQVKNSTSQTAEAVVIANDYMAMPGSDLQEYLSTFQFNGLSNWRCLTTEEATYFRNKYYGSSAVSALNIFLLKNDVSPFKYDDGDRYFCNGGESSFSFTSQSILKIGTKKSYYIRPVKTVKFVTK